MAWFMLDFLHDLRDARTKFDEEFRAAKKAQRDLCDKRELPHLAPKSGICPSCEAPLYVNAEEGSHYVVRCPKCGKDF